MKGEMRIVQKNWDEVRSFNQGKQVKLNIWK